MYIRITDNLNPYIFRVCKIGNFSLKLYCKKLTKTVFLSDEIVSKPIETFTSKNLTLGRRLSFQQYYQNGQNGQNTGTIRSRISIDSLSSEHPSTSEKLGNKKSSDEDEEEEATDEQPTDDDDDVDDVDVTDTMRRNRGPRPAYSDANMQHSLGYLP